MQNAPQPCTSETQGLLYFDLSSSKMYRCRHRQWQEWDWRRGGASTSTRTSTRTGSTSGSGGSTRQQTSVRRAASTPGSSPVETAVCPTGIPITHLHAPVLRPIFPVPSFATAGQARGSLLDVIGGGDQANRNCVNAWICRPQQTVPFT